MNLTERLTHLWSFPDEVERRFLMIKHGGLTGGKVRVLIEVPLLQSCLSQFLKVRGGHLVTQSVNLALWLT